MRSSRPSRLEFSNGFLQNLRKFGLQSLRRTPKEGIPSIVPGFTSGQLDLNQQPQPQLFYNVVCIIETKNYDANESNVRVNTMQKKGEKFWVGWKKDGDSGRVKETGMTD